MAKKEKCENCGKLVKSGFFSYSQKVDGKFLCEDCAELAKMDPERREFVVNVRPKLLSDLDVGSIKPSNIPFISYSEDFFKSRKREIKKTQKSEVGFVYRSEMDIDKLKKIYETGANFDIVKEIPLFYYMYGGIILDLEWLLITNIKLYYNIMRSKKSRDSDSFNLGSISLADITGTSVDHSSLLFAGLKGLQSEFTINGQLLGAINVTSKSTGGIIHDYLSVLALRNQELITDRGQPARPYDNGGSTEPDIPTKIKQLKGMLDDKIITEEEFHAKKQELLEKM